MLKQLIYCKDIENIMLVIYNKCTILIAFMSLCENFYYKKWGNIKC